MPLGSSTVKCIFLSIQSLYFFLVADWLKKQSQHSYVLFLCTCIVYALRNSRQETETVIVIRLGNHKKQQRISFNVGGRKIKLTIRKEQILGMNSQNDMPINYEEDSILVKHFIYSTPPPTPGFPGSCACHAK